jgi:hypothetical protein
MLPHRPRGQERRLGRPIAAVIPTEMDTGTAACARPGTRHPDPARRAAD